LLIAIGIIRLASWAERELIRDQWVRMAEPACQSLLQRS
jgi:hypothetical protein